MGKTLSPEVTGTAEGYLDRENAGLSRLTPTARGFAASASASQALTAFNFSGVNQMFFIRLLKPQRARVPSPVTEQRGGGKPLLTTVGGTGEAQSLQLSSPEMSLSYFSKLG